MSIAYEKLIQNEVLYKKVKNRKEIIEYEEKLISEKEKRDKHRKNHTITEEYKTFKTKYIISGHVIEKYEYSKVMEKGVINDSAGRKIISDSDNKEVNRKVVVNRAKNKVKRLINANSDLKTFITLTFADNIQDLDYSNREFKKFIQRLNEVYEGFKYVAVIEFQKRGAIHYHMISNIDVDFAPCLHGSRKSEEQKAFENYFRERFWWHKEDNIDKVKVNGKVTKTLKVANGWVDVRKMKVDKKYNETEVDNIGAYVTKYMTEDLNDERLIGRKMYLTSKNLAEPICVYVDEEKEIDVLHNVYNLDDIESVFSTSFTNDYTGEITYKQYNLKRLNK